MESTNDKAKEAQLCSVRKKSFRLVSTVINIYLGAGEPYRLLKLSY